MTTLRYKKKKQKYQQLALSKYKIQLTKITKKIIFIYYS